MSVCVRVCVPESMTSLGHNLAKKKEKKLSALILFNANVDFCIIVMAAW